jgi:hypothetical protein
VTAFALAKPGHPGRSRNNGEIQIFEGPYLLGPLENADFLTLKLGFEQKA